MPPRRRVMLSARGEVCVRGSRASLVVLPEIARDDSRETSVCRVWWRGVVFAGCGFRDLGRIGAPCRRSARRGERGSLHFSRSKKGAGIAHGERAAERSLMLSFF